VRRGRYKLLQFFEDNRLELYDLEADVGERRNLAISQPDIASQLLRLLEEWRAATNAPVPTEPDREFDRSTNRNR
jgi:hypothetical protein